MPPRQVNGVVRPRCLRLAHLPPALANVGKPLFNSWPNLGDRRDAIICFNRITEVVSQKRLSDSVSDPASKTPIRARTTIQLGTEHNRIGNRCNFAGCCRNLWGEYYRPATCKTSTFLHTTVKLLILSPTPASLFRLSCMYNRHVSTSCFSRV